MKLTIERMAYGPDGLAHTPEGKAVFVAGGIAGDVVEAEVDREEASLVRARATAILEPQPDALVVNLLGGAAFCLIGVWLIFFPPGRKQREEHTLPSR